MTIDKKNRNLSELSVKQQLGLYVVLTRLFDEKNKPFFSSNFAREMRVFLRIDDPDEYRKTIGGILGALSKNEILEKKSNDRNPLWALANDIHSNPGYYRKQLQHIPNVKITWEK